MSKETRSPGRTTVAPDVILSIARLTAISVEGVSQMSGYTHINELFQKGHRSSGVRINIDENIVNVDLYVVLENNVNVRQISRDIQQEVSRAIIEMVGMETGQINIHVEDIDYSIEE
ncbi:MAG: Asp23/Gls24 family envelope stress response protein [Chloroflexi bacterium]|jgi:uncharacterized alkaline shock family protein YloU|nr:Asp23/Gls24 family envelope stress response protein [Chloroflexota bacterium]MBT3669384.1 Asp23/Gls24 family envelope stress response protein [Chloroflexota bacterium]MBT4304597.1 Asp23/Gls24 family envelope stress response protein [Chloroflexota bacterium]MBT4534062.1 Asp23/Gls24 family envelope stress response protein [Chloroflexota bacterium]MBT4683281.1 Asp23/Gls24 family envelope stress response protein [Chloroflexota bacterium]